MKPKVDNEAHSHLNQSKPTPEEPFEQSNELHVHIEHISKLYMDNTGRFRIRSRSVNQYHMVACHFNSNALLFAPFKSGKDLHQKLAYN